MQRLALASQPIGLKWPTREWPEGDLGRCADKARFERLVSQAFVSKTDEQLGETFALVITQGGRLIREHYGEGYGPEVPCPSWSMAKSITQALAGLAVKDGRLDIMAEADVPEWREAGDARRGITTDLLLRMSSGLAFREEYEPDNPSDVIDMLWLKGKDDTAHFAASFPLAHAPGSFWYYSSGTTNIVSRCISHAIDAYGADFESFMRQRLFDVIGMQSAVPQFDPAGTFIGSSFCFATPRDFARFGYLYLRDGIWDGTRVLPEGWVDYAARPTWQQPNDDGPYGAHWWLGLGGHTSFSANGYEGQYIVVVPELDMVVVRNGKTEGPKKENVKRWLGEIIDCFRQN